MGGRSLTRLEDLPAVKAAMDELGCSVDDLRYDGTEGRSKAFRDNNRVGLIQFLYRGSAAEKAEADRLIEESNRRDALIQAAMVAIMHAEKPLDEADMPAATTAAPSGEKVIDFTGAKWSVRGNKLWPDGASELAFVNIWVRGNGTGLVRVAGAVDRTGWVVDFGDVEVTLTKRREGLYVAELTSGQVREIKEL